MKLFLKLIPIVILLLSLSSCDKTKRCALADKAVNAATEALVLGVGCSGEDAIKSDLKKMFSKIGFCKEQKAQVELAGDGALSHLCQMMVKPLLDLAIEKAIPSSWECTGGVAEDKLEDLLIAQCKKINI